MRQKTVVLVALCAGILAVCDADAAQYGRPCDDITTGSWTPTPLWTNLCETVPDDAGSEIFLSSVADCTNEVKFSAVSAPTVTVGHVVRYRAKRSGRGTPAVQAHLYQGTTLVSSDISRPLTWDYTNYAWALSGPEAESISDYSDLRFRFVNSDSDGTLLYLTWVELEVPDAPPPPFPTYVSGTIAGDVTWVTNHSPYIIVGDTLVTNGVTLTIDPGVEVRFEPSDSLIVWGSVVAIGSPTNHITFVGDSAPTHGGGMHFDGDDLSSLGATGAFEYCDFSYLTASDGDPTAAISAMYATLTASNCTFGNMPVVAAGQPAAVRASYSRVSIVNSVFEDICEGINLISCAGVISSNYMSNIIGYADAIDLDNPWPGSGPTSVVIEANTFLNGPDPDADAIDIGYRDAIILRNVIKDFGDKGISLDESCPDIINNLIVGCNIGVAAKRVSSPRIFNNTIVSCTYGIRSYIGINGGYASNDIIWNCGTSISLEEGSTMEVGHSLVGGPGVWPGENNITNSPDFVDAPGGNYRINPGSPCADSGVNMDWMIGGVDLPGNARIVRGTVDMGAYESAGLLLDMPLVVTEGDGLLPSAGTVSIPQTAPSNTVVSLLSDNPGAIVVPSSATILIGTTSAVFDVSVIDDGILDGSQPANVTATSPGYDGDSVLVTVNDDETATLAVMLPASAMEGDGTVPGTVSMDIAPTTNITVSLSSDDPSEATVPSTAVINAGQTSTVFNLTVVDDAEIDGLQSATVTAHVDMWTDGNDTIDILDNEGSVLRLNIPAQASEGAGTAPGFVSVPGMLTNTLVVSLFSSDTGELQVSNTVTIASGSSNAPFDLTLIDELFFDGAQAVTVSATAAGFTPDSEVISVTDDEVHHFGFSAIGSPQTAGIPIAVTISAEDINDDTISVYSGPVGLSAAGDAGSLGVSPTGLIFTAGQWPGGITLQGADSNVVLQADDDDGVTGQSDAFDVGGPMLVVSPTAITNVLVVTNSTLERTLVISNSGNASLTFDISGLPGGSQISSANLALLMDSDDEGVSIADTPSLDITGSEVTLACWARRADTNIMTGKVAAFVYKTAHSSANGAYGLLFNDRDYTDAAVFVVGNSSPFANRSRVVENALAEGDGWHHIVGVYSSGTIQVYVDGEPRSGPVSGSLTGNISANDLPLIIGYDVPNDNVDFYGWIDEVQLWDRALPPTEVMFIMSNRLEGTESGLVGYWNFDDGTPNDCTTNGSDGVFLGGATTVVVNIGALSGGSSENVLLHYDFDADEGGTVSDQSGNGFTGTVVGASWTNSGHFGGAMDFERSENDRIAIGDLDELSFGDGTNDTPLSLSMWVKPESTGFGAGLVCKYSLNQGEWWTYSDNNVPRFLIYDCSEENGQWIKATTTMVTGTWYHLAFTYDGRGGNSAYAGMKIFVNGVEDDVSLYGDEQPFTAMENKSSVCEVGRNNASSSYAFDGMLDDVRVYNRLLSSNEVWDLYTGQPAAGGTCSWLTASSTSGALQPGQATNITLTFDSSGLPNGSHRETDLIVTFDAPGAPTNIVPVAMNVTYLKPITVSVPSSATEGDGILPGVGSVTIPTPAASNTTVNLSSDDVSELTLTNAVVIYTGMTSAFFDLVVQNDGILDGPQIAVVSASSPGYVGDAVPVTINDNETATLAVTLPATATEGDGTVPGTVSVNGVPATNITVALSSDDPSEATVPASVVLNSGQTSAVFNLTVVDDGGIDGAQPVTVTAHVDGWTDGNDTIDILDDETTALLLVIPAQANEDAGVVTGTVYISGTLTNDLLVSFFSSDPTEASATNATIAAGATSAPVVVTIIDDTFYDGVQSVTVTATAAGFTPDSGVVDVIDDEVHHFGFTAISGPQLVGVAIPVTISAEDINSETIPVYAGPVVLSAAGDWGSVDITPTSVIFAAGQWTGDIALWAGDDNVVVQADDGSATGQSDAFDVEGPIVHVSPASITNVLVTTNSSQLRILTISNSGNTVLAFDMAGFPVSAGVQPTNGLLLYYPFATNEGAVVSDESGNGFSGVVFGATWTNAGYLGGGQDFENAEDDRIYVGGHSEFSFGDGTNDSPFTVTFWAKHESVHYGGLMGKSSAPREWMIINNFGKFRFYLQDGVSGLFQQWIESGILASPGSWHHYGFVYDGRGGSTAYEGLEIYFDGIKATNESSGGDVGYIAMKTSGGALEIGRYDANPAVDYDGIIDELRIYDHVISSSEMWSMYGGEPGTSGWVTADCTSGTVQPDQATNVMVTFDGTGLTNGTYETADLLVICNDATSPTNVVPVAMLVTTTPWLTVNMPPLVMEGDGWLAGAGSVTVREPVASNVTVELSSDDPGELSVPGSTTILSGNTNALFDLMVWDDADCDSIQHLTISATASGFIDGNGNIDVVDDELHHFGFLAFRDPQTSAVPFDVTVRALDISNVLLATYSGVASLSAAGDEGPAGMVPAVTDPFVSGQWNSQVMIGAVDLNVVLTADGDGRTGNSSPFDVVSGFDTDGDGMPDWWELSYGLNPGSSLGDDGAGGDPDGDGMLSGDEYEADTIPTNSDSLLVIEFITDEGADVRVGWQGGVFARQFLERRPDLLTGNWSRVYTNHPLTAMSTNFLDSVGTTTSMFYRIKARR